MKIELHKRYKARIKYRRGDGWDLKPIVEEHDGKIINTLALWEIEPDDSSIYVGEIAMQVPDEIGRKTMILWMASGDLEILGKVD